ncbi:MAG: hypothetical protein ACRDPI_02735 [Nocardioidaceae bacterium]
MRQIIEHPIRSLAGLLVLAFCFFMLSAAGQADSYWKSGPTWLGNIAWIGFLLSALLFIVVGATGLVRAARSRRTA